MERPVVLPSQLPVLSISNQVLLPTAYLRLKVPAKAKKSVSVIESLYHATSASSDQYVAVFPAATNNAPHITSQPAEDTTGNTGQLVRFGTAAKVLQVSKLVQTDEWVLVVEGVCRISFTSVSPSPTHKHDLAAVQQLEMKPAQQAAWGTLKGDAEYQALARQLKASTHHLLQLLARQAGVTSKRVLELLGRVPQWRAADVVASALTTSFQNRLEVLLAVDPKERVRLALKLVAAALEALTAREAGPIGGPLPRLPRADALVGGGLGRPFGRAGAHAGQEDEDGEEDDVESLVQRLRAAGMPPDVLKLALKEVRRLRQGEQQPGSQASRTYLELLADLPWARLSTDPPPSPPPSTHLSSPPSPAPPPPASPAPIDLREARDILDRGHHGLDKVKERIVQYLAVLMLRGSHARAPILCFIGPPGVGKTSVARSVAEVLRRPFVRISLGGVRDEAEVRGHRRTYVGALPGRIVQGIKRANVRDPVLLLDEIDKLGRDSRGDPAAALLEVLDPEQNHAFTDTYLGVPFNLAAVTFLATANKASDIPAPLLDRLEVIQLAGYTQEEKVRIAAEHLLPQQLADHGLAPTQVAFPPASLAYLIDHYTREAGVRSLSRALAAICRHVAVQVVGDMHRLPLLQPAEAESYERDQDSSARSTHPPHSAAYTSSPAPHPLAASLSPVSPRTRPTHYGSGDIHLTAPPRPPRQPRNPPPPPAPPPSTHRLTPPYLHPPRPTATGLPYTPDLLAPPSTALHTPQLTITPDFIQGVLGPAKFLGTEAAQRISSPGAAAGLVWTSAGGMVQYIECCQVGVGQPGRSGSLKLTGQVGEVLEESAQIAMSWIRSHAHELGLEPPFAAPPSAALWQSVHLPAPPRRQRHHADVDDSRQPESSGGRALAPASLRGSNDEAEGEPLASRLHRIVSDANEDLPPPPHLSPPNAAASSSPLEWDVHVHLPAGAIPKDGPSAGITLAVALLSLLSGRTARADTAMTGELTLRGLVLPVGGIKEKLLAAQHCGLQRVLVPVGNAHEVAVELPPSAQKALEVVPVARLEEVLMHAFDPPYRLLPPRARL